MHILEICVHMCVYKYVFVKQTFFIVYCKMVYYSMTFHAVTVSVLLLESTVPSPARAKDVSTSRFMRKWFWLLASR